MKNKTKFLFGIVLIGFTLVGGCVPKGTTEEKLPVVGEGEEDEKAGRVRVIELGCAEGTVHYEESITWSEEPEEGLKESLIEDFKETTADYSVEVKDCSVKLEGNSTTLSCFIYGSKQASWYDFDWFLRHRGLDFLDSPFEQREQELVWKGNLDEVYTTVSISFPWPISNCHEHVWER